MRRGVSVLAAVFCLGVVAGCGDGGDAGKVVPTDYKAALAELGEALKSTAADGKKPPTRMAEFEMIEPMAPTAGPLIRSGELIYLWGGGYVPSGTKVVAYQKKAEAEGGPVLLQDGTVKVMTADEVKAAPKAGTAGAGKK